MTNEKVALNLWKSREKREKVDGQGKVEVRSKIYMSLKKYFGIYLLISKDTSTRRPKKNNQA